ncbi:MAG: M81 family metallopeptidase [Pseudomonadota bacterium]
MRIFLGGLFHETNDFSPVPTGRASFEAMSWRPRLQRDVPPSVNLLGYGGALARARGLGLDVVAGPYAAAIPSARAGAPVWAELVDELLGELRAALPVDAVYLFLHGAMSTEGVDDCEGEILARVRELIGPDVPLGSSMDLHGTVTTKMLSSADFVVACKEYPHVDLEAESARGVDLLLAQANARIRPVSAAVRVPMLLIGPTTSGPLQSFVTRLRACESGPGMLSASAFHGFFGADHPDAGAAVVVTTDGDPALARRIAMELAQDLANSALAQGNVGMDLRTALEAADAHPGTVILADRADNSGGGAGGDSTLVLAELLRRNVRNATLGMMWDPVAADFCALAGEGSRLRLRLGGKVGPMSGPPLDVDAHVLAVREDVRQAAFGRGEANMPIGRSAAVRVGGVDVVIGSIRHQVFSRHVFEEHGIELANKKLVVVKSTQHFYEAFAPLGKVIYCDVPGTVTSDFSALPYARLPRPMWPIDPTPPVPAFIHGG